MASEANPNRQSEPVANAEAQDASGVGDQAAVNQPNPQISRTGDGEVVFDDGVSGPDPRFWGEDTERPDPFEAENAAPPEGAGGTPPDTISAEGVSGPDSRWWTKEVDADGTERYVGRDDLNYLAGPPPITDLRSEAEGGNAGA